MKMGTLKIIIHANLNRHEYFFSTDHCQGVCSRPEPIWDSKKQEYSYIEKNLEYPEGFVPTTFHLPMYVVPRPSLPSGIIRTKEELVMIFHGRDREIPNPDPKFQPQT